MSYKMHIAFNALGASISGLRSYTITLANELPRLFPDIQYTFYVTPSVAQECVSQSNMRVVVHNLQNRSAWVRLLWEQFWLPRELKHIQADLLYTFSSTDILASPCPTIIRIGNMAPYENEAIAIEKTFKAKARLYYLRWGSRIFACTADCVLASSEAAGKLLVERYGFPKEKTIGINRGVDFNSIGSGKSNRLNLPESYILHVGHFYRIQKILEVVSGYYLAYKYNKDLPPLVLIGSEDSYPKYAEEIRSLVKELNIHDRVWFLKQVDRNELYSVYRKSTITIYSSIVESFGVTLREQLFVGGALIVAKRGIMPGICGESVIYYDPNSPEDLCEKIITCMESEQLRSELRSASKKRIKELQVDWPTSLRKRQALFEKIALQNSK